jgi:hypothetical protein
MSRESKRREAALANHDPMFRGMPVDVIDNHLARCDGCTAPPAPKEPEASDATKLAKVRELVAAADALRPEDFKTGQNHLPPAFREINYRDAFMALAHLMEQIEEVVGEGDR